MTLSLQRGGPPLLLININSAGKRWSQACSPITETLWHLQSKTTLGAETKELASLIVSSLRAIAQGAEESAIA
jgi:hypothetical protein